MKLINFKYHLTCVYDIHVLATSNKVKNNIKGLNPTKYYYEYYKCVLWKKDNGVEILCCRKREFCLKIKLCEIE